MREPEKSFWKNVFKIGKYVKMFFSSFINAKLNLIAGMAMGAGLAMICKEIRKKKVQLDNKNNSTQHETSDK